MSPASKYLRIAALVIVCITTYIFSIDEFLSMSACCSVGALYIPLFDFIAIGVLILVTRKFPWLASLLLIGWEVFIVKNAMDNKNINSADTLYQFLLPQWPLFLSSILLIIAWFVRHPNVKETENSEVRA